MSANNTDGDVSGADVTLPKNPAGINTPLSEVGSPPTSPSHSDGIPIANTSVSGVPAEFFAQMMQMMKHVSDRMTKSDSKVKISDIFLPSYDPDSNIGIREWCKHVSTAMDTYNLSDYDVRMKVGSLLKGRARLYVDNWLVSTGSWEELRDVLITTFEPESRYSRDVFRFREHVYDSSKNIAQFLSEAWVLWQRVTKDKLTSDDAVEAVIGCVSDERLRIELLNARAKSVPELISVASSIRPTKRLNSNQTSQNLNKRPRLAEKLYCQVCKRTNHDTRDCRFANKNTAPQPRQVSNSETQNTVKPTCTFCSKAGHTYETCFKRERSVVSNVNCVGKPNLTWLPVTIGNFEFTAIFDSGAECSLIRESVAAKIPGKRVDQVHYLKAIGQFTLMSLTCLTTICQIDNLRVELQFHVVPDYEICSDMLIGTNLIKNTYLSVLVTAQGAKLLHQPVVYHMHSQDEKFDRLITDLSSEDQINELKILLNKYTHLFIRGYPRTRVN